MAAGRPSRGDALLLAHVGSIARLTSPPRSSAHERLARALGPETAARLVGSLAPVVRRSPGATPRAGGAR